MLRNLIVLPDGTEISTGKFAVQNAKYTSFANSGTELTIGSVCSSMLEVKFFSPEGSLEIEAGTEVTYYKVDDFGVRHKIGLYTLETPNRPSKNTYKFTAYDRVSWLDKDLTDWLDGLDGWPYSLLTFAVMVCDACGLTLYNGEIPNGDFPVEKFRSSGITGRKLMEHIGQLAARFARATPEGLIEFAWYTPSGVILTTSGDRYYQSLNYEDYRVAGIGAVQIRLADSESGLLWPAVEPGANSYILPNNPLITSVTDKLLETFQVIQNELSNAVYTPCKVTFPASLDIQAGTTVDIIDANGKKITTYVMQKTQKVQWDTIESFGSPKRDNSTNANNATTKDLQAYADAAASAAVNRQTQRDIFNKLTNNGQAQGLFLEHDGQVYVNARYMSTGILASKDGKSFFLDLDEGTFYSTGKFMSASGKAYITLEGDEFVLYAQAGENGEFLDIGRIGFTEDSEGYDYPYFLMGNSADKQFDQIGLIKMFKNGLYAGNSAPRYSTGSFVGLAGAAGIFVDTVNAVAYVVSGTDMKELYTGTVEAVFA